MSLAGFPPHHHQAMNTESTATSPSLEKEDTVEDYFCRVLYKPKLKQEVEIGDLGS